MTITRANVEKLLVRRCGKWMTAAGLDGTTVTGANLDLADPIGYAVRALGYTVTDITAVADADLASVTANEADQLLDVAELRTLESIAQNYDSVNITVGPRSEALSDLLKAIQAAIVTKREHIESAYGDSGGMLSAGAISLDFQQHDEVTTT